MASTESVPETPTKPQYKYLGYVLITAFVVIVIDQVTKWIALTELRPRTESIEVIGTWLQFTYVENTGAAFGLGSGYTIVVTCIAAIVAIVIIRSSRKLASVAWAIALGGLLGGALGNLIDRLIREPGPGRGFVVDFIQLPYWPVFNVADMAIVGSAILMVILSLRDVPFSAPRVS